MAVLFKIGNTDLTKWEYRPDHAVNREDVFETWTDGNWIEHRTITRTRIAGTVKLNFAQNSDFMAFLALMTSERTANGYYPVTVWCENTGGEETINAFLDITAVVNWDVTAPIKHQSVTVAITQI